MKHFSIFISLSFFTSITFSQINNHITSDSQNHEWLKKNNTVNLQSKLKNLKERLLFDTAVTISPYYYNDRIGNRSVEAFRKKRMDSLLTSIPTVFINGVPFYRSYSISKQRFNNLIY